jgi:hypothetical protein
MKLEDQVCSFEQAERLKNLIAALQTYFCYSDTGRIFIREAFSDIFPEAIFYPAPTVAEFGVLLGKYKVKGNFYGKQWTLYQTEPFYFDLLDICPINTQEAQARAEALIWLIENDLLIPGELKL